jgi:non-ribosomal peptide synthetase-like protein
VSTGGAAPIGQLLRIFPGVATGTATTAPGRLPPAHVGEVPALLGQRTVPLLIATDRHANLLALLRAHRDRVTRLVADALEELMSFGAGTVDDPRLGIARLAAAVVSSRTDRHGLLLPPPRRIWRVGAAMAGTAELTRPSGPTRERPARAPACADRPAPHPSPASAGAPAERLHHRVEQAADARPDAVALECDGHHLTYRELDGHANRLAHLLLARGLRPGARVGVLVPRSVEMYVAVLGALKAGAAFVPIDPGSPADRVGYIVDDAGVDLVLTTARYAAVCDDLSAAVVHVDAVAAAVAASPSDRPDVTVAGDPTCYIIYTSGSSGPPKGVEIAQSSICNYVRVLPEIYGLEPGARVYQGMTISFDFSMEEIWLTWAVGATVVAGPTDGRRTGPGLADFLEESGVTILHCVPTVLATLDRTIPAITTVNVGGEACPPELVERWAPGRRMLNTYGPTETTITATWARLEAGRRVTIGRPLPTYTAVVLDDDLRPVAGDEVGELCIGGPGLARGYVNRPDLTAEKFVRPGGTGARIYRTGDLCRMLPNGEIEYLGRADAQVKIRGHRVDLQEIESVLLDDDRVVGAVVAHLRRPGTGGELAGYVVPGDPAVDPDALVADLHARARTTLPAYMVPTYIEPIAAVPMMPSGKVDRKALPEPTSARLVSGGRAHRPAQTPTEQAMAAVWEDVLGLDADGLSVDADFFDDLGGHSLLAATVVSRLRAEGIASHLSVLDLYDHPTVRRLAAHQDGLEAAAADAAAARRRPARPPGWRVAAFGLVQLAWIFTLLVVFLLPVSLVYAAHAGQPSWTVMWHLVATFPATYVLGRWLLPVVAVRALTAGIRAGTYPLWGRLHLRVWAAHKLTSLSPLGVLAGSPWAATYLRLAGADVGTGCHVGTAAVRLPRLVTLEDGATVNSGTHLVTSEVADGVLTIGAVRIGADAVVGGNCVLQGPCSIGAGAVLAEQSLLQPGDAIPPHERWGGSPGGPRADGDDAVDQMVACPSAPRRWPRRLLPLFAVGIVFLEVLPLLALAPVVGLVWWTLLTWGELPAVLVTAASGPVFVVMTCLLVLGARRLTLRAVPVGIHHLRSRIGVAKWFGDKLLERSLLLTNTLYATLYTPTWLRALGAQVGRRAEVSTIANIDPDLLALGDDSFVADMATVGAATHANGHLTFRRTTVGRRTFVGNAAFVRSGVRLGDSSLVGVLTIPPAVGTAAGSSWLGSPPFYLPQRETWDGFTEADTFRPGRRRVAARYAIELVRIVAPSSLLALSMFATLYALSFVAVAAPAWAVALATPLLALLAGLATVLVVALVKWVLVGRYRPRVEPLWSGFVRRSEFVTGLYEATAVPVLLGVLTGTPLLGPVLRLFGTRVGRRTLVDTTYLSEFDLVHIGDDVTVGTAASLQTHLFEDRVMKMSTVELGARASVGTRAIVLYDTVVGEEASLAPLSLVMKAERLLPRTRWRGIPVRAATDQRPLQPTVEHRHATASATTTDRQAPRGTAAAAQDPPGGSRRTDLAHACTAAAPQVRAPQPGGVVAGRSPARRIAAIDLACGAAVLALVALHALPAVTAPGTVALRWALTSAAALLVVLGGMGLALRPHRGRVARRGRRWPTAVARVVAAVVGMAGIVLLVGRVARGGSITAAAVGLAGYTLVCLLVAAEVGRSPAGGRRRRTARRIAARPHRPARAEGAHRDPLARRGVDLPGHAQRGVRSHRPVSGSAAVRRHRLGERRDRPDRPPPRRPDDQRRRGVTSGRQRPAGTVPSARPDGGSGRGGRVDRG